jgi:flagellar basal-body rod protein FlgF
MDCKTLSSSTPGAVITTGNAMDVVMNDKTVLGVQAQNGEIGFTRRGDLRVSPTGVIENAAGHLILGEQGPINVPQGQLVTISPDGTVYGQIPNQPDEQPEALGQLLLRDASETPLTRRPDGLFEPLDENLRGADFITGPYTGLSAQRAVRGQQCQPYSSNGSDDGF